MSKQTILDNLNIRDLYKRFVPALTGGLQASGKCPLIGHDDKKALFSVNTQTGLFNCRGCGRKGDIFTFYMALKGINFQTALADLEEMAGISKQDGNKRIIEEYDYVDAAGHLLYQIVRYEPKDFRSRRKGEAGEWIYNLQGIKRVLYNLPEVIKAEIIYFVEGEKDTNNLKKLELMDNIAVTTSPGGSKSWKSEFVGYLQGKTVIIFPDNDTPGLEFAETVANNLHGKAKEIKVIELPGFGDRKEKHGPDISDWIKQRAKSGKTNEDIKTELIDIIKTVPPWDLKKKTDILSSLESWEHIQSLDIKMEWVVDRLIPKESINLVFGKGGIGKTWLIMDMARSIGGGIPFLGLSTIQTTVIFIDFENPLVVLNTRTQKLGKGENVLFWRANNDSLKPPRLDSRGWELYKSLPYGAVLIFDTLRAAHGKDENASDGMSIIMGRLKELRDIGFTIILLHHTAKNSDKVAKGSTAIVDLADHIMGLTRVKHKNNGHDIVVDDDEDDDENTSYRFGVIDKTRFEPYHIYLSLNPDRGFELAPDPQEDTLKEMHQLLTETGEITKTEFIKLAKKTGAGEKKLRKLVDLGSGRYWRVEKRQHNASYIIPIYDQNNQFGTPI